MEMAADPRKISQSAKDYLVAYGADAEFEHKLTYRIFIVKNIQNIHKAIEYFQHNGITAKQGKWDAELTADSKKPWRRHLLSRHIPSSHLPPRDNRTFWFNAELSFSQVQDLSLQGWVQEIRTVSIPGEMVRQILTRSAISQLS